MHEDLRAIDVTGARWHETLDKGHGRLERRRCDVVEISGAQWDGYAALHGRRQTICVEREREVVKTGERNLEVTWRLTSLGPERVGPEELLELVRNHRSWKIACMTFGTLPATRTAAGPMPPESLLPDERCHRTLHQAVQAPASTMPPTPRKPST